MAEVIATINLGAAVISFIDLGGKVVSRLKEYYERSSEAPKDLQEISARLELLLIIVESIERARQNDELDARSQTALEQAVNGMTRQVNLLQTNVEKLLPRKEDSRWRLARKAVSRVRKDNTLLQIQRRLETYESTLTFYFSCAANSDVQRTVGNKSMYYFDVSILPVKNFIGRTNDLRDIVTSLEGGAAKGSRLVAVVLLGAGGKDDLRLLCFAG